MSLIITTNNGPLVESSTYWGSDYDRAGKLYVSVNEGTIRVLIPQVNTPHDIVAEFQQCRYVILSRGPWPNMKAVNAVELLLEDGSDSPYAIQLTNESFDLLPAKPPSGREWKLTVWIQENGLPCEVASCRCLWRLVEKIPCLKPWKE